MSENNLSTLKEFKTLKAYERIADYRTVSSMFKYKNYQVKAIVENKQSVLDKYAALPIEVRERYEEDQRLKTEQILEKTVYECLLRVRRNPHSVAITHTILRQIALDANLILDIRNFSADQAWILAFRHKYNITNSDLGPKPDGCGPKNLDIKQIIAEIMERENNDKAVSTCSYKLSDSEIELIKNFTRKSMSDNDADPIPTEPEPAKKMKCNDDTTDKSVMSENDLLILKEFKTLKAYERIGDYKTVSSMFKYNIYQVKAIVENKQSVLDKYAALPIEVREKYENDQRLRAEQIDLLEKTVYECFRRVRRNKRAVAITHTFLRNIALGVNLLLDIRNFSANQAWILAFRQKYNITNSGLGWFDGCAPLNLDIKQIIAGIIERENNDNAVSNCSYKLMDSEVELIEAENNDNAVSNCSYKLVDSEVELIEAENNDNAVSNCSYKLVDSEVELIEAENNDNALSNFSYKLVDSEVELIKAENKDNALSNFSYKLVDSEVELIEAFIGKRMSNMDADLILTETEFAKKMNVNIHKNGTVLLRHVNRLSLFDKLQAIKAYEKIGNYTPVALLFSCSMRQIRKIVTDERIILERYLFLPSHVRQAYEESQRIRVKRIILLNKTVYEWFRRARRNRYEDFSQESVKFPLRKIALKIQKNFYVDNFDPDYNWLALFLKTYNITLSDIKLQPNDPGPLNLDIKEILADVIEEDKNGGSSSQALNQSCDIWNFFQCTPTTAGLDRTTKLSILDKVMLEWFQRARRNPSVCPISGELIKKTAFDVKYILNIGDEFFPNNAWLVFFRQKHRITASALRLRLNETGSSDLNIEAIISQFTGEKQSQIDSEDNGNAFSSKDFSILMSINPTVFIKQLNDNQSEKPGIIEELSEDSSNSTTHIPLNLQYKIRVIEAYTKTDNYSTVSRMFRSTPENIKTIIDNKDQTLAMFKYTNMQKNYIKTEPKYTRPEIIRDRKVAQHNTVMYEWFLRALRNPSVCSITNELLIKVATEAKEALVIDKFFPNKSWVSQFRRKYNITDADLKRQTNDPGPIELDIKAIITELDKPIIVSAVEDCDDDSSASCSLSKPLNVTSASSSSQLSDAENGKGLHSNQSESANARKYETSLKKQMLAKSSSEQNSEEMNEKTRLLVRAKKVTQLGKVLFEWFLRARRNPSISSITKMSLLEVAIDAKEVLNIVEFVPKSVWISDFLEKYNITDADMELRPNDSGPLELDIRSIVRDVVKREKINRPRSSPCDTAYSQDNSSNATASNSLSESESEVSVLNANEDDTYSGESNTTATEQSDEGTENKINSITLLGKVRILEAFEKNRNWGNVGRMFSCDPRIIKQTVESEEEIMALFLSDQESNKEMSHYTVPYTVRYRKISLFYKVILEWLKRAKRDPSIIVISDNLIKKTANEIKKILKIDNFYTNHTWLNLFREKYNLKKTSSNLDLDESQPLSLDIKQIIVDVFAKERSEKSISLSVNHIQDCKEEPVESDKEVESDKKEHSLTIIDTATSNHLSDSESSTSPPSKYIKLEVDGNETGSDEDSKSIYIKLEVDDVKTESDEDPSSEYIKVEVDRNNTDCDEDSILTIKLEDNVIKIECDEDTDENDTTQATSSSYVIYNLEQALEHLKPLEEFALLKEDYRLIGSVSQLEIALKKLKSIKNEEDR